MTSIMITARETVSRVTPPMKAPAPMRANAPGSTQAQGLGCRNTPGGALCAQPVSSLALGDLAGAETRRAPRPARAAAVMNVSLLIKMLSAL